MKNVMALFVLFVSLFLVSCSRSEDLGGDDLTYPALDGVQHPARYTRVIAPDMFVVQGVHRFGHDDMFALVVARSGLTAKTFVVPAATKLKAGDVIKVFLLCYRAEEEYDASGSLKTARNACADVVIPQTNGGK